MTDLIDTTEMYLRTIFELEEEGLTPLRARIAERIGHSGPTVSQTVARMERDGLLVVEEDRHLRLTDAGRTRATAVMRKHRLAERLLLDVIGLDWPHLHDEACRWEHVMSEDVERRLLEILDHPALSPYGNPIPGLEELGEARAGTDFMTGVSRLTEALNKGAAGPFLVVRMGESLQTRIDLMTALDAAGVRPGVTIEARRDGGDVVIAADGNVPAPSVPEPTPASAPKPLSARLGTDVAKHIFVEV
ncbi:MAG: metal-dependent transcriptional regulator [Bifidobacteriaceae bacterium]|nr:metal-dependent transcriptional regulator [Bifidobacteriaceae bacterium]